MQLPDFVIPILFALVTFLVTEGLKALSQLFGKDISGAGSAITAAIVAGVVAFANTILGTLPASYVPFVQGLFTFLGLILSSFRIHSLYKAWRPNK